MSKNKRVPEIRFEGFEGEWEDYRLGDLVEKIGSGKTPRGGESTYLDSGIPLIRSQNIYNETVNLNNVVYISDEINNEMLNSQVIKNDVLLNITGASIGRSAVYKTEEIANVNQHVCIIRLFPEVNSIFVHLNLVSDSGQKQIDSNQAGGAREGLNFQQIAKFNFTFPRLKEQKKIGMFFEKLNQNIEFRTKELKKKEDFKQAMLQKMFPKEGEKLPEIRFDGFEGEWEEVKIKHLVDDISDGDWIETEHIYANGVYRIIQTGNISEGTYLNKDKHSKYIKQEGFDELKANEVYPGDILTSRLAEPAGRTIIMPEINNRMVTSVDVMVIRPSALFNSYFFMTQMNTNRVFSDVEEKVSGTSHRRISRKNLENILVRITSLKEQEKIGNYFKELDTQIKSKQSELNKLKQFKQAMLDKMFV